MDLLTVCEVLGTITGLAGALCQARREVHIKFWGFVLFVFSDICLAAMGIGDSRFVFTFLQVAFGVISSWGLWTHRPSTWRTNG